MMQNIRNAAVYGSKHGARGLINTDWGDAGHWQHLPASCPGFMYGAAMSWGVGENAELDIGEALNRFRFRDAAGRMGRLTVDFGNYYQCEQKTRFNGSGIFRTLYYARLDDTDRTLDFLNLPDHTWDEFDKVHRFVSGLADELELVDMKCTDAALVKSEYRQSARLILHGARLGMFKLAGYTGAERQVELEFLMRDLEETMDELKANWLARNRAGGLEDSLTRLNGLLDQYRIAYGEGTV